MYPFSYSKAVSLAKLTQALKPTLKLYWHFPFQPLFALPIYDHFSLPNKNLKHVPPAIAFRVNTEGLKTVVMSLTKERVQLRSIDWVVFYVNHQFSQEFLTRSNLNSLGWVSLLFPSHQLPIALWWEDIPESYSDSVNWANSILKLG